MPLGLLIPLFGLYFCLLPLEAQLIQLPGSGCLYLSLLEQLLLPGASLLAQALLSVCGGSSFFSPGVFGQPVILLCIFMRGLYFLEAGQGRLHELKFLLLVRPL